MTDWYGSFVSEIIGLEHRSIFRMIYGKTS